MGYWTCGEHVLYVQWCTCWVEKNIEEECKVCKSKTTPVNVVSNHMSINHDGFLHYIQHTFLKMDISIETRETRLKILNRHFIPCLSNIIYALAIGVFRSTWKIDGEYLFELPLDRENYYLDCVIDWGGESKPQHITRIEDCVHDYEGGVYEIKITGKVAMKEL